MQGWDLDTREGILDAALGNLLWFLCDPEAEDFGEPQEMILDDAVAVADALGVHWRSGR